MFVGQIHVSHVYGCNRNSSVDVAGESCVWM